MTINYHFHRLIYEDADILELNKKSMFTLTDNGHGMFAIDSTNGQLILIRPLQRYETISLNLTVSAKCVILKCVYYYINNMEINRSTYQSIIMKLII